uniref:Large ribosomal subunit protein bL9m n=1 Tax=Syphacia muris TaxID=451379 RepID=A0A0N5ABS3_9BILA
MFRVFFFIFLEPNSLKGKSVDVQSQDFDSMSAIADTCYTTSTTSSMNTWVLRRVHVPNPTPEGKWQRNPEELPYMMRYEVVENENEINPGPIKVILLEDVEGVGNQFDVIDVERNMARNDLILSRKAVYASPFDLKYYGALREKMKEELSKKVRIPYDYIVLARELVKNVIPIHVSLNNPWILNRSILLCALIEKGIHTTEDSIFLTKKPYEGPNMELENRLIRFYIVIGKQYIIPMLGRISHIASDQNKQVVFLHICYNLTVIYPEMSGVSLEKEMRIANISAEAPYFHRIANITSEFDVAELMEKRCKGLI